MVSNQYRLREPDGKQSVPPQGPSNIRHQNSYNLVTNILSYLSLVTGGETAQST